METATTDFQPQTQGFQFANSFDFPDFFQVKMPFAQAGMASLGDVVYGLCGGMCFAAIDYFNEKMPVPVYKNTDEIPWRYFLYFWQRQLHSLKKGVIPKLFKWMLSDDISVARNVNRWEVPKILKRLKEGQPVPLVLVRTKGLSDPMKNHQVLAIGYEFDPATKDLIIQLYDPNHPGKQPKLTMNLRDPGQGIQLAQSTGEALRGFFAVDYQKQTPPA